MQIESQNWQISLAKVVAQTWADESFRQRFLAEPAAVLREAGMALEDSVKVVVNEGGSSSAVLAGAEAGTTVYEISLPSKPEDLEAEQLFAWFNSFVPATASCC
jgi:hypothetical protein